MKISRLAILAALPLLTSCTVPAVISSFITPHMEALGLKEVEEIFGDGDKMLDKVIDAEIHQLDPTVK